MTNPEPQDLPPIALAFREATNAGLVDALNSMQAAANDPDSDITSLIQAVVGFVADLDFSLREQLIQAIAAIEGRLPT